MATFKERLPATQDLLLVFSICAFPVYVWSILNVLKEVPAWLLRLNSWDLVGMVAYTQLFALIESSLLFLVLLVAAGLLPAHFFRARFVAHSGSLVLLTSAWIILAHSYGTILDPERLLYLGLWLVTYLIAMVVAYLAIRRSDKMQRLIYSLGNRLIVLSSVYVIAGVLSAIIVIIRNV